MIIEKGVEEEVQSPASLAARLPGFAYFFLRKNGHLSFSHSPRPLLEKTPLFALLRITAKRWGL